MEVLGARGWTVADTPASGDFGADLIAEKDGKRIAIQAKRYSKPVGNKAVNEALGGRDPSTNATRLPSSRRAVSPRLAASRPRQAARCLSDGTS